MSALRDEFRSLAWALCQRRDVPLLVTDMIADYLVHRDLFKISTLSRSLNERANAVIYRDVVVNLDGSERSITTASLLFRTLLTSEAAARAVRTLSLAGDPLHDWRHKNAHKGNEGVEQPLYGLTPPPMHADLTDFTEEEIKLYEKVAASFSPSTHPPTSEVSVWALYLHAFRLAPHIQDLSVKSDYFRFPDFRSTLQDMARDPSMQKLRSCSLALDLLHEGHRGPFVVDHWDSALLMPFVVPDMQSVSVVANLKPEAVRQLQLRPGGNSITRLTLNHYQDGESGLSSLLAATPSIRYLKYHVISEWSWLTSFVRKEGPLDYALGIEDLYGALHHVGDSLQELHISQELDEDSIHRGMNELWMSRWNFLGAEEVPFRQREELSSLKRLHTLTIPWIQLIGLHCVKYAWDWDKTLPSSLRRIVWTDDVDKECNGDDWDDQNMMPVISGLVEWLSAPQRGSEAAEFGLYLNYRDTRDFHEPMRQRLTQMCEERGVQCTIKKVCADLSRPNGWKASVPLSPRSLIRRRERDDERARLSRGGGRVRGRSTFFPTWSEQLEFDNRTT
jgi:hypothetical protein